MNSDADGPDEPGTTPAPEAGRAGGRFEALRQRSSTVQDQVSRRRGDLERSRHLGLLQRRARLRVRQPLAPIADRLTVDHRVERRAAVGAGVHRAEAVGRLLHCADSTPGVWAAKDRGSMRSNVNGRLAPFVPHAAPP